MSAANKVDVINLSGGLLGLLLTNPKGALNANIERNNREGWRAVQVLPYSDTNLLLVVLKLVVLVLTLFLWTWGAGYMVLYEKR